MSSKEIRKKIEEAIANKWHYSDPEDLRQAAEFGYQLAKEEMEKQLRMTPIVDVRSATDPTQDEL